MLLSSAGRASLKPVTVWQISGSILSPGANGDYKNQSGYRDEVAFVATSCLTFVCMYACVCPPLITIVPTVWMRPESLTGAPVNFVKIGVHLENKCPAEGRASKFMLY